MSFTKFEKARIIGARALQISMGAPVIIDIPAHVMDPVDIAIMEFDNNVIPITIKRENEKHD
jgi:DNA-directed RNA polymerase subunit K